MKFDIGAGYTLEFSKTDDSAPLTAFKLDISSPCLHADETGGFITTDETYLYNYPSEVQMYGCT